MDRHDKNVQFRDKCLCPGLVENTGGLRENLATGFTIADKTGRDGTDQATNVQRLQFADDAAAFDLGGGGRAFRIGQAAFKPYG